MQAARAFWEGTFSRLGMPSQTVGWWKALDVPKSKNVQNT